MQIVAPPLQEVRDAVFERIESHAATNGHTLAREGQRADMPYIAIGSAYKGAGGTDRVVGGATVIVQIDAYASSLAGGSSVVSDMIEDVYEALSDDLPIDGSDPAAITVEDDVLNPTMQDQRGGEMYAQRFARFRFTI